MEPLSASSAPSPSTVKSIRVFIGCVLGAEAELEKELNEVRPLLINSVAQFVTDPWKILNIEKGGVLLETTLLAALQLNYWLKIGNRVLLRLGEFNCTSLPRLRDRFKKIQFPFKGTFEVRAEANRCKVSNEKTILRICEEIWPVEKGSANRVFIRGQMDEWTVSLDSSGEHLHKRGIRKVAGAAPLRETLAALTLRYLCEGQPRSQLLQTVIVDPMAGSGTFILEALTWFQPVKTREFAFEGWQSIPKILKSETFWANYKNHPLLKPLMPFGDLHLIEQDADLLEKVRDQFGKIHGVEFSDVKFQSVEPQDGNFQGVKFHSGRFCDFSTRDQFANHEAKLWVVTNPPYGERIDDKDWLVQFIQWIKQMRPDKIAIWLPLDKSEKIGKMISDAFGSKPDSDKHSKTYQISNGGIRCAIKIF